MKIPNKVKVLAKTYNIFHDNEITGKHLCYGVTYHDNQETFLRKRGELFSEEHEAEVFLHEMLHNIDAALSIGLTEEQTNLISTGMFCLIRDNNLDFRAPKE